MDGPLEAAREIAPQNFMREGGPAGCGVYGAAISAAPERPGGAVLRRPRTKRFLKIFRRDPALRSRMFAPVERRIPGKAGERVDPGSEDEPL
jgi:hypothetical protein